jgi:pimeloyl-ACP methyl ester carboxylesterase
MSRVDASGVAIEYHVTGQGRPVILLHGFPDSGRLWRHQVPALAAAGFQVIVPDLRGFGSSGKPANVEAYSLALLAGDVHPILADLGITRCHVAGQLPAGAGLRADPVRHAIGSHAASVSTAGLAGRGFPCS